MTTVTVNTKKKRKKHGKKKYYMINVTLDHRLDEFLQSVGNEARSTGGHKLPKTLILRGLALVLRQLRDAKKIDLKGVTNEADFVDRLREAMGLK